MISFNQFKTIYDNIQFYKDVKESRKNEILCIKEGLIQSFSYNTFKLHLKRLIERLKIYDYEINLTDNYIELKVKINKRDEFLNSIKTLLNQSGYIVSNWKYIDGVFKNSDLPEELYKSEIVIRFNKKYDFKEGGIKLKMFHVTNIKYLKKILKKGILPKSKNVIENHEERVYLFDNIESAEYYLEYKNEGKTIDEEIDKYSDFYIILEIDIRLVKKISLYKDPKFMESDGAYYTYDSISPISIKVL